MTKERFIDTLTLLSNELQDDLRDKGTPTEQQNHFNKCFLETTQNGKLHRGLTVLDTGSCLLDRPLSSTEFNDLSILGWLTEIFQAAYLIWDDIMDKSEYRRGKPCWYLREGVGLAAINDAALLNSSIFFLLRKHFKHHPSYVDMLELFHEVGGRTELGQLADTVQYDHGLDKMSVENWSFIVTNKTAYYSIYLPVSLALLYVNISGRRNLEQARGILLPMGEYFQAQDDYLDVYGDPAVTERVGTDIQDKKCTWLVVEALRRCDKGQRQILEQSYGGGWNDADVNRAMKVLETLDMRRVFSEYENAKIQDLQDRIESVDESYGLTKEVFYLVLGKITHRSR
ncbi:isoprenoid synthase domain-containing protein [Aspergillus avenaceus]|uniref:Isoprenoid synthase domain-containing protein n=1 Tax=Aspergillus avenaceus TaxID=36643 RepID=A0A5N6TZ22_ASPAV|nr:isoprenoid synthase domain-containing protein [Aspergillus avenaceus]